MKDWKKLGISANLLLKVGYEPQLIKIAQGCIFEQRMDHELEYVCERLRSQVIAAKELRYMLGHYPKWLPHHVMRLCEKFVSTVDEMKTFFHSPIATEKRAFII